MASPISILASSSNILTNAPAAAGSFRVRRGRALPRCGCKRCATAFSMLRSLPCTRRAGARRSMTQKWLDHQAGKVTRSLAVLESNPPALNGMSGGLPNVGQIGLACALGYRDFRFGGDWRNDHPRLVAWLDAFAARVPAFAVTNPSG